MNQNTVSYWNKTAEAHGYPPLDRDVDADVLIIGGGITGVTCAYCLAQRGVKPVLIEAEGRCAAGTTGNTTGKITIQHGIIYSNIVKRHGLAYAKLYAKSQSEALDFVRKTVRTHNIDCQLQNNTAYVYATAEGELEAVKKEYETALTLGIDAEFTSTPGFPEDSIGSVGYRNQAVLHPVRYVDALAGAARSSGAEIYCDTKAVKVEDGEHITVLCENDRKIKARHLVMATQHPIYDVPSLFFTRLYAKRTYGIAVQASGLWPAGSYINAGSPSRSLRTHFENGGPVLIVVGEGHATGRGQPDMDAHFEKLIEFAQGIASVDKVLARWSAQDYETPDQIPYIGRLAEGSNIHIAAGFGKWGLTSGTLAGTLITDIITSGSCRYEELYSRSRADFSSAMGKTVTEVLDSTGELIKSKFKKTESMLNLQPGEGRVIDYKGRKAGAYLDFDGILTVLDISCTHMSTELNFNSAEKTWDCPAHGGRFGTDGSRLEGPPKDPLKVYYHGKYSDFMSGSR